MLPNWLSERCVASGFSTLLSVHPFYNQPSMSKKSKQSQGLYLADRDSISTLNPSYFHTVLDRPLSLTKNQSKLSLVYSSNEHRSTHLGLQPISEVQDGEIVGSVSWYHGNTNKAAARLGIPTTHETRTRLSLTPSVFQLGAGALSVEQTRELARLRYAPAKIDDKAVDTADEPPDGSTLAWNHAAVGHLVVFNAQ